MNRIDHIMRHEGLLKLIREGNLEGKNHRKIPKIENIQQILKGCDLYV